MQLKYNKVVFALVLSVCVIQSLLERLTGPLAVLGGLSLLGIVLEPLIAAPTVNKKLQLELEKETKLSLNDKQIQEFRLKLNELDEQVKGTSSRISALGLLKRG